MHQRVMGYIDGFNLYFGLRDSGWERLLWLDPVLLIEKLLKPHQELIGVRYFTARLSGPGPKWEQQGIFLDALSGRDRCTLHLGQYQTELRRCSRCRLETPVSSEKMTDVKIATEMLADGFQGAFDSAILVSGDGDLAPALRKVRDLSGKRTIVAFPPKRSSGLLKTAAHAWFHIGRDKLAASQLPDQIVTAAGVVLERPTDWR